MNRLKFILLPMLCIFLISGCETNDSNAFSIDTDKIVIFYNGSSKVVTVNDEETILHLTALFHEYKPQAINMVTNPVDYYTLIFYKEDVKLTQLKIYNPGLVKENDKDEIFYKAYDLVKEIHQQN